MTEQSYKILAAKRLAIDPAEILMYFELEEHSFVTTPDGKQHIFSFADLRKPANKVAETAQKGAGSASAEASAAPHPTKKIARRKI